MPEKIRKLDDIDAVIAAERERGHKIVHCHGVFDLLHPGHIRHLQEAKKQGDKLVVSLTPDHYVNKGPGRPAFGEKLRLEQIASLSCVDFVVLNDRADAISIINKIKPDIYAKGSEYLDHTSDLTGKISFEAGAVEGCGGKIFYTDDIVFSSSALINKFLDSDAQRKNPFMERLKDTHTLEDILHKVESLSDLKVLVIGDAIIDRYQYVNPLGQAGKGVHLTAALLEGENFLGGSLIIANHIASFVNNVTLVTGLGKICPHHDFIKSHLHPNVIPEFTYYDRYPTLEKKRYVIQDGHVLTKLFETYSSNGTLLNEGQTDHLIEWIEAHSGEFDLVLVCDFGNGFINPRVVHSLCQVPSMLAVNTQTNSGNRGYNVVTGYSRADFISVNEPELRLAAHDRYSSLEEVTSRIAKKLKSAHVSVTRGVEGVYFYSNSDQNPIYFPALTMQAIDRVGAGDSYFSLAALCIAKGHGPLLSGFVGSVAAAMGVQIVGNKEAINKTHLSKYITRLMK